MKKTKRWVLTATLTLCGTLSALAQEAAEQFSIASLNVDGLPKKVLVLKVNPDGPGDSGTARIGKYLLKKGYDLVMMQEDFNYHDVLSVLLEDDYNLDTWSGDVGLEGHSIDFLHLQNHRFECDGLMGAWKNDLTVTPQGRTPWEHNFGKFSHANDEIITKGFRRYDVTLRDGTSIVVYNMHMDASDDEDEMAQNDAKDKEARMAQWAQLRDEVLAQLDSRPIVIVGDMNSFYGRDNVKQEFIDAINTSGRAEASDVWVQMERQGIFPETLTPPITPVPMGLRDTGETLDKILYVNPANGTAIQPVSFAVDSLGYQHDGKAIGDHYPVTATFQVVSRSITDINSVGRETASPALFHNLNGQRLSRPKGICIEQRGEKTAKRIIK